jgi:hypothetical protein
MWIALITHVRGELQQGDTVGDQGDTTGDTINPTGYEGLKGVTGVTGGDTDQSQIGNNGDPQEYATENVPTDDAQIDDAVQEKVEKSASSGGDTGDQGDTAEAVGRPQSPLEKARIHIAEIAEKRENSTVLLGQVVYAVLEAKPGKFANAEAVIECLTEYPELPDDYTWELDKVVTLGGGMKFFDFAIVA